MPGRRLGCISGAGIIAVLVTLLLTTGFVFVRGGSLFSPGPLNAQASGEALGGIRSHAEAGGRCAACHTAPWAAETLADRCLACHTAIAAELADPLSLHGVLKVQKGAGGCRLCHTEHRGAAASLTVVDPATFPHDATGYVLSGHSTLAVGQAFGCVDCHPHDLARFDTATCDACHRQTDAAYMQAHTAAFESACLGCHDGADRYGRRTFDHRIVFPLTGKHATVDCVGCHPGARSVADLQAAPTACVGCHEKDDQHKGQFGAECGACHKTDTWQGATFDHSKSAFPLTGKHAQVDCVQCHANNVYKGTPQTCVGCHEKDDQHKGQFGADCGACHKTDTWQGATFDHSKSAFPLTGKHTQVDCVQCHANNVYKGTPQTCVGCHEKDDQHMGQFGAECGACHKTDTWQGATFDHSKSAFPLTGKHTQVDCVQCHANNIYKGTPQTCVDCHEKDDQHKGQFGADCGACHKTDTWQGATFDHSKSAFPLTGKHAQVDCVQCHANNIYKGTPQTCVGCHEKDDQHKGQFGAECGACHKTDTWQGATFDHSKSAFPLTGKHAQVDCVQCHVNNVYKGTPQTCIDCHEKDDQHKGQFGADCGACHKTDTWQGATFDHSKSAFPLTGKHAQVDCVQCHVNNVYKGTPQTCVGCHQDPAYHLAVFGTACADCHTADAWRPARYNGPHTFPYNHGESGSSSCNTCHPAQVKAYTCYGCHEHTETQIADKHREEGIADLANCMKCHSTGQKEEGGGGEKD